MTSNDTPRAQSTSNAIPINCTNSDLPSAVREFAELLAEIALQQLRSTPNITQGEQSYD